MKRVIISWFVAAIIAASLLSVSVRPAQAASEAKPETAPVYEVRIPAGNLKNRYCKYSVANDLFFNYANRAVVTQDGIATFFVDATNYGIIANTLGIPLGNAASPMAVMEHINTMPGGKILDSATGKAEVDLNRAFKNDPCGPDDTNGWPIGFTTYPVTQDKTTFSANIDLQPALSPNFWDNLVRTTGPVLAYLLAALVVILTLGGARLVLG